MSGNKRKKAVSPQTPGTAEWQKQYFMNYWKSANLPLAKQPDFTRSKRGRSVDLIIVDELHEWWNRDGKLHPPEARKGTEQNAWRL